MDFVTATEVCCIPVISFDGVGRQLIVEKLLLPARMVMESAYAVGREFRFQSALHDRDVPVAKCIFCVRVMHPLDQIFMLWI